MRKYYAEISKVDADQRLVYGYASTEALDSQGEVVKVDAIKDALDDYMKFANIREMHQPSAVGIAEFAKADDKGLYLCAKVVDDGAWDKVKAGVYKGFSIGGRALAKTGGVISKMRLMEISLVDRPANPECMIEMFKRDASDGTIPPFIAKSMYNVAELATLIASLGSLRSWVLSEGQWEGDTRDAEQAARMGEAISTLLEVCSSMVTDEGSELLAMSDKPEDVVKVDHKAEVDKAGANADADGNEHGEGAGKVKSPTCAHCGKSDEPDDVQKVETQPAGDPVEKVETTEEGDPIAKAVAAATDEFKKALDAQRKEFEDRLAAIMATPVPPKGVVTQGTAVTKADDAVTGSPTPALDEAFVPFQKALVEGNSDQAALEHIKLIHKFGGRAVVAGSPLTKV